MGAGEPDNRHNLQKSWLSRASITKQNTDREHCEQADA